MNDIKITFDKVYNDTYEIILKYVISKTDNLDNVEDIIQNVYIIFYNTLLKKGPNHIDNYEAYLIKICKSELFKYYTFKNKVKYIFNINGEKDSIEDIPDKYTNIEDNVINKIELEDIWNFIKKEDLLTGKIMALYFQNDMKIKDIAEVLNTGESNIKNRLYRTLDKLKSKYGRGEDDE